MGRRGLPPSSSNLRNSLAPSAYHSNLRTAELLGSPLLGLKMEKTNDLVVCAMRTGNEDLLTSFSSLRLRGYVSPIRDTGTTIRQIFKNQDTPIRLVYINNYFFLINLKIKITEYAEK